MDPRHTQRIKIIQNLFAYTFQEKRKQLITKQDPLTFPILEKITQIDQIIKEHAARFPIDKIVKTDLAILRWAIFELNFKKTLPQKVVINEAVELAKELSGERSFAFVNAVLGKVVQSNVKYEK